MLTKYEEQRIQNMLLSSSRQRENLSVSEAAIVELAEIISYLDGAVMELSELLSGLLGGVIND